MRGECGSDATLRCGDPGAKSMTVVFISYSHHDEEFRQQLEVHLAALKRQGAIDLWHDRRIPPGGEIDDAIDAKLNEANLILLLVSPDFIASDYCYNVEMRRAIERHSIGEARVVPVILRHCDWRGTPFGRLNALPTDGRPVTKWPDRDEAFQNIVTGIKTALGYASTVSASERKVPSRDASAKEVISPRSSNLRTRKHFTEADKDRFLEASFEYIALFFENSLKELEKRNPELSTTFRRVSSEEFTAIAYRGGKAETRCRVRFGGPRGVMSGITYSSDDSPWNNSFNESFSAEAGVQDLHLKPLGMRMRAAKEQLSQEGGAEYFWEMFIEPLQN
jgi:hypothetical protein